MWNVKRGREREWEIYDPPSDQATDCYHTSWSQITETKIRECVYEFEECECVGELTGRMTKANKLCRFFFLLSLSVWFYVFGKRL